MQLKELFRIYSLKRNIRFIEISLVFIILGTLSAFVISLINPYRQIARSRNTRRKIDAHYIALGLKTYQISKGTLPVDISEEQKEICKEHALNCSGYVDLSDLLDTQEYMNNIPVDPKDKTYNGTGYAVYKGSYGSITVVALMSELGEYIEVKR